MGLIIEGLTLGATVAARLSKEDCSSCGRTILENPVDLTSDVARRAFEQNGWTGLIRADGLDDDQKEVIVKEHMNAEPVDGGDRVRCEFCGEEVTL